VRNEKFRNRRPKRGCSHVERRVTSVKVVRDFVEKEVRCALASGAVLSRRPGKSRIGRQAAGDRIDLALNDKTNEINKDRIRFWHRFLVRLTVRCNRWLSGIADQPQLATLEVAQPDVNAIGSRAFDDVVVLAQAIDHNTTVTDRRRTLVHLPAVVVLGRVQKFDDFDQRILGEHIHVG
jgi:hypothetical protein